MTDATALTAEQWNEARRLFDAALELSQDRRPAWLDEATDDALVRAEVAVMLAGHDRLDDWFVEPPTTSPPPIDEVEGFRLVRELASGGMGRVYEAERIEGGQRVALKVIRPGLLSPQTLRRFRREAESLARLRHPAIAQVLDAGTARGDSGDQPYIAMELVDGDRLDVYLSRTLPSIDARIEMLATIADAVQHAHERGIVHRDLKPGNILVDRSGRPKVVDFGVARMLGRNASMSDATVTGQLLGTVPYMSPEQVGGRPEDVDARSDVYALGVLGFEMLTGTLPYDVRDKPVVEAARIIDSEEPTPLSTFDQRFSGAVETIIGTALAKEPARRYPSASAFAADLRRWLVGEAIEARRPGPVYQLRRFSRRNRGLVAGLAVAAATLVAGTGLSITLAVRAAADAETARVESERASRVQRFLQSVLAATDPRASGGSIRAAVTLAASRVDEEFADDPIARIVVLGTISDSLVGMGDLTVATECAERAWALVRSTPEVDGALRTDAVRRLAERYRYAGRGEAASDLVETALAGTDAAGLERARLLVELGRVRSSEERFPEAVDLFERALETLVTTASDGHVTEILCELANARVGAGMVDEAVAAARRAVELVGGLDPPTGHSHLAIGTLALTLYWRAAPGDFEEAEAVASAALELARRSGDDAAVPMALSDLAVIQVARGDLERAIDSYHEAIAGKRAVYGQGHYEVAQTLDNLAGVLERAGRVAEAVPLRRESLAINRRVFGPVHQRTRQSLLALADDLIAGDEFEEARALLVAALEDAAMIADPAAGLLADGARERLARLQSAE